MLGFRVERRRHQVVTVVVKLAAIAAPDVLRPDGREETVCATKRARVPSGIGLKASSTPLKKNAKLLELGADASVIMVWGAVFYPVVVPCMSPSVSGCNQTGHARP